MFVLPLLMERLLLMKFYIDGVTWFLLTEYLGNLLCTFQPEFAVILPKMNYYSVSLTLRY